MNNSTKHYGPFCAVAYYFLFIIALVVALANFKKAPLIFIYPAGLTFPWGFFLPFLSKLLGIESEIANLILLIIFTIPNAFILYILGKGIARKRL